MITCLFSLRWEAEGTAGRAGEAPGASAHQTFCCPPLNFAPTEPRRGEAQEGEQPAGPCPSRPASIVRSIKEFDPLWEFLLVFRIPFVLSD